MFSYLIMYPKTNKFHIYYIQLDHSPYIYYCFVYDYIQSTLIHIPIWIKWKYIKPLKMFKLACTMTVLCTVFIFLILNGSNDKTYFFIASSLLNVMNTNNTTNMKQNKTKEVATFTRCWGIFLSVKDLFFMKNLNNYLELYYLTLHIYTEIFVQIFFYLYIFSFSNTKSN